MGFLASLWVKIGADTKDLEKGLVATKSGLTGASKNALTSVASFAALTVAAKMVGNALRDIVEGTANYGMQVRDLGRMIGASAEESSKLIQAADDVFVSYESLSRGMQIAIRNGIDPSVEGMGKLADQYLSIQSPIERTKFLLDTFGRSGAELAPLLEKGSAGIKELGDAAEKTGLVLSQDAVNDVVAYKESVDNLGDSWQGLMMTIGTTVIPVLNKITGNLNNYLSSNNAYMEQFNRLKDAEKNGLLTKKEYNEALKILNSSMSGGVTTYEAVAAAVELIEEKYGLAAEEALTLANVIPVVEGAMTDAEIAALEYALAISQIGDAGSNFSNIVDYAEEYTDIQQQIKDKQHEINVLSTGMTLDGARISAGEAKTKIGELRGEITGLQGDLVGLANTLALEMAMAVITADNIVSEAEMAAYWGLAVDLGVVSQEAADAAELSFKLAFNRVAMDFKGSMPTSFNVGINWIAGPLPAFGPAFPSTNPTSSTNAWSAPGGPWVWYGKAFGAGMHGLYLNTETGEQKEFARGGHMQAGSPYLVGEAGPELVVPDQHSMVVPNDRLGMGGNDLLSAILRMPTAQDIAIAVRDAVLLVSK